MPDAFQRLSHRQRSLVAEWLPGAVVEADLGWGLVETTVLAVSARGERFVVKAGGPSDRSVAREIDAHRNWLGPWTAIGRAPALVHHDAGAKLLVTEYLPGTLVLDTPHAAQPGIYRQAGELLAAFHAQTAVVDDRHEQQENERVLAWLDRPHRISPTTAHRIRAMIERWPTPPAVLVPTHGDWHTRNWLVDGGTLSIIDFGRVALRPAATDVARLAGNEFRRYPGTEGAFLAGYGRDPREPEAWFRLRVREAVSTAAWAYRVGDEAYEAHGHRMIAELLAEHPA